MASRNALAWSSLLVTRSTLAHTALLGQVIQRYESRVPRDSNLCCHQADLVLRVDAVNSKQWGSSKFSEHSLDLKLDVLKTCESRAFHYHCPDTL